jgi:hypothetical protein
MAFGLQGCAYTVMVVEFAVDDGVDAPILRMEGLLGFRTQVDDRKAIVSKGWWGWR